MKKRRLSFLIVNLIAILAALGSAFLPWWQGMRPTDVPLTDILPLKFLNNFGFTPNVVVAIFVGAAIIAVGALLAFKWVVLLGAAVGAITIELWFLHFNIGWQPSQYGHGLYLLAASVIIAVFSLFIPRRRRRERER